MDNFLKSEYYYLLKSLFIFIIWYWIFPCFLFTGLSLLINHSLYEVWVISTIPPLISLLFLPFRNIFNDKYKNILFWPYLDTWNIHIQK